MRQMARKLKTYTTSAGFFDLAVAAPSMKAALEAWGARNDLFRQGFAAMSDDPAIVAATMASPGVVLRRAVGTREPFRERAELPRNLPVRDKARQPPTKAEASKRTHRTPAVDDEAGRNAAAAYEKEQKRRREEAARQKARQRRERAIAAADAALEKARRKHDATIAAIEKQRAALDSKIAAEEVRWRRTQDRLEAALRRARSVSHLRAVPSG
ncbi:MAG: cell envelope biogenesis protein TolA [Pseudomonadota bacterium]